MSWDPSNWNTNPPYPYPPPEPPRRLFPWLAIGAVVMLVAVGIGVAVYLAEQREQREQQARREAEARLPAAPQAFQDAHGGTAEDLRPAIERTFAALLQAPDLAKGQYFDMPRLVREACQGLSFSSRQRAQLERQLVARSSELIGNLNSDGELSADARVEVRRLERLRGTDDVVVYAVHRLPGDVSVKYRWWLTPSGNQWRIYDAEVLFFGMRTTEMMNLGMTAAQQQGGQALPAMREFNRAVQALIAEDFETMRRALDASHRAGPLPRKLAAVRYLYGAVLESHDENWDKVLEYAQQTEQLFSDAPLVHSLRASAHLGLQNHAEAETHARRYLQLVGNDAEGNFTLGEALREQGKLGEAAQSYTAGLDEYADSADNLYGLAQVLELDNLQPCAERLQQCSDLSATYDQVAGALLNDYQLDRLLALVQACRAQFPENHNHEYYEGMVYLNRGEPAQAEPLFRAGLKICPADEREYFQEQLIDALLRQDKFEQAYQEADDPRQAFQQMLDQYRYNHQKLEQVLALHRAKHPADPWLPYGEGLILVSRNQLDEAVGKFQPLLNTDDDQLAAVVSENYLGVMIRLGRYVEALESVPHKEDAFHELVRSLNVRIKANELEALANAYALYQPRDPWVAIYRARAQYFRGNFPAAADQLQDQFDRVHPDDKSVVESYYIQARVAEGNPQRAYRDAADKRAAFQQLAREFDCPLHHARLRDLITIHQAVDPRDPYIPYYQGRLLVDSDPAQAAQIYLQAWQQADRNAYSPAQWEYPRIMVNLGQEQEALRHAPDRPAAFSTMAWQLSNEKQFDRLAALCAAYAEMLGDERNAALLQFQGLAARQQGDSARAVELLNQAVAVVQDQASDEYYDDEELEEIYEPLAELLVERGEALQAYEASSDRATLGYWLLEELQEQQQWDVAIELAKRYAQEFPADTWNFALLVDSYLGAKQFDEAEQWCRRQVHDNPGEDSEQLLRETLVKIRYRQGQFREAYQTLRPARNVLSQLVNLCVQDSDAATLAELVALHREQDPEDPGLLRAEIELARLNKDFSKLADLLLEQDARRKTGGGYYYLDEELLRALARSGRSQQALQLASVAPGAVLLGEGEYYQRGMIYALAGKHEQALEAFQRCLERISSDDYRIQSIYNSEELGPIVREHAAYAPLREKYPPPPKDE